MGSLGKMSPLIQVMALRWLKDKPLTESMLIKIYIAIWRH